MESNWQVAGLGLIAFLNYSFAFIVSIEIASRDLLTVGQKLSWTAFAWLIPLIGPFVAHRHLKIGWARGRNGGGNSNVPPGDGGAF